MWKKHRYSHLVIHVIGLLLPIPTLLCWYNYWISWLILVVFRVIIAGKDSQNLLIVVFRLCSIKNPQAHPRSTIADRDRGRGFRINTYVLISYYIHRRHKIRSLVDQARCPDHSWTSLLHASKLVSKERSYQPPPDHQHWSKQSSIRTRYERQSFSKDT